MRYLIVLVLCIMCSCKGNSNSRIINVLENDQISSELHILDEPERAIISWYLFAYGNACETQSTKCKLLNGLGINDECNPDHLNMLLQWFSTDMLSVYKLRKCPNLTANSAIQNTIDKIVLTRNGNTISIEYKIKGMNNSQEKSWNIDQTDTYLIKNETLVKVKLNER